MASQLDVITGELPVDPDAQATVTDFLDYTEYLPSDLIRSLTLIGKLDTSYLTSTDELHSLTKSYGILPNTPHGQRQNPQWLRQEISQKLQYALSAREASSAEATRMYDMVDRHANRLTSIISKLNSLPKPPSRDPTPAPQLKSPQTSRVRPGLKGDGTPPPRVTLRLGGPHAGVSGGKSTGKPHRPRYRSRKITVPGEVLPPPNPDSPPPVTDSEWESIPPSPIPMPTSRVGVSSRSRPSKPGRIRVPKPPKAPKIKLPKAARPPRPPGAMGTNVHSAVAGISTSNALSLLSPPPPDAKPGSEHAPWMRLTEWEMAKLRKRMKKNAIWSPSETMIRRELSEAGRGPENYRASKAKATANGEDFIDCDNIATTAPGKPLAPGEISADSLGLEETQLSNRGMKLNEAKKLKRENTAREQAAAEAAAVAAEKAAAEKEAEKVAASVRGSEVEQAVKRLGDIGSTIKSLFTKPTEGLADTSMVGAGQANSKHVSKEKKKDKEALKVKEKEKEKEKEREREREKEREREREKEKEREREKEKEREREREREKEKEREKQREIEKEKERGKERERERELEKAREREREKEREREREIETEKEKEKKREREKEEAEKKKQEEIEKEAAKTQATKRKREPTPAKPEAAQPQFETATSPAKTSFKRRKLGSQITTTDHTSTTTTTVVPLAAPAPSPVKRSAPAPVTPAVETRGAAAKSSRPRRLSLALKGPAPPSEPARVSPRTSSRAASRRASTGPPSGRVGRNGLRRRSATPARPPTPIVTAASRRSKRPAPGFVTSSQDDGPAVSVGRRKNAPRKRGNASAASAKKAVEGAASAREKEEVVKAEEEVAGDFIDPDEPRYCVCGDVSFGTMICCENTECEREWFHLECVGLQEPPPRRTKWYCPDCKVKLKK